MYLIKYDDKIVALAYSGKGALKKLDSIIDSQNLTLEEAKKEYKKYDIEWSDHHGIIKEL